MDGVIISKLKQIEDERGKVMHFIRSDWEVFKGFGEVYFTTVKYGKIKGWNKHTKMTQNLVCPSGNIMLVLYDERSGSPTYGTTQEISIGGHNYCLVTIPPGIWVSFTSLEGTSILANCASVLHDPNEAMSLPIENSLIPYTWNISHA